jgi:hypothetical protein
MFRDLTDQRINESQEQLIDIYLKRNSENK